MSYLTFEQLTKREINIEEREEGVVIDESKLCYVKYDTYHGNQTTEGKAYLPIEIQNSDHKKKLLIDYGLLVVLIHAKWCHPCKSFKPMYIDYAKTNLAKAHFAMEDVDLRITPEITAVPSMIIYKKGKVLKVIKGGNLDELTYELPPV